MYLSTTFIDRYMAEEEGLDKMADMDSKRIDLYCKNSAVYVKGDDKELHRKADKQLLRELREVNERQYRKSWKDHKFLRNWIINLVDECNAPKGIRKQYYIIKHT